MPDIVIIVNAGSGTASKLADLNEHLTEAFRSNGIEADIKLAKSGAEFTRFAKEAAQSDCKIVVAGGGDGTISGVAAEIVDTDKILGVLPLGTLNHFSKDLHIPQDIDEAVRVIGKGHTVEVDVGEMNGRIFLNNSSIGLYPRIVLRREKEQHRLGVSKWVAALWATLAMLRRYPFLETTLKIDNKVLTGKTPFIFVGNNEYKMEAFNIGRRERLDAGKLSLYLLHNINRLGLVVLAARTLVGRLRQAKDFEEILTEEVEINTRRKKLLLVAFDGEVEAMKAPLKYRIRAKALKVIVPGVNGK